MAEMNIEIAVEPDTLELMFEIGGGTAPQPVPVPSVILSGVPTWIIGGAASGAAAAGTTEEE